MPTKSEIIGYRIGKIVRYSFQTVILYRVVDYLYPPSTLILKEGIRQGIKQTAKYSVKGIRYVSRNYTRKDYLSETIFSDAVDASFFAD